MSDTFNFRNPEPFEVSDMHRKTRQRILAKEKYVALSKLLNGETIDATKYPQIFEALNRERMEFDELLKLHPDHGMAAMEEAKFAREQMEEGKYWNRKSPAKWGHMGEIPTCIYYSRPPEYWKDKKILKEFFNMYPKFRISSSKI